MCLARIVRDVRRLPLARQINQLRLLATRPRSEQVADQVPQTVEVEVSSCAEDRAVGAVMGAKVLLDVRQRHLFHGRQIARTVPAKWVTVLATSQL